MHTPSLPDNQILPATNCRPVRLKGILAFSLVVALWMCISLNAGATNYYLYPSGAAAQTLGNWWTNTNGTGSNPANFTTNGDAFIIPTGISGVVSGNWIMGVTTGASLVIISLTIDTGGTLTINSGFTLTLKAKATDQNTMTVNGSLIFLGTAANQLLGSTVNLTFGTNTVTFGSGSIIKTVNTTGITGATASVNTASLTFAPHIGANYEFNGAAQTVTGITSTVNNLTFSGSGAKTLSTVTTITGNFTLRGCP